MVEEIIYTSAEKGLKQGSRGFCTVVSTSGMALNIAERLESMSGYRLAFPASDARSALNPVNYSYVTMRLAGKKLHVLSRVADAGQDYTGRSNKLAHHIVIDSVAHLTPGPARLLADPAIIVDHWDGVVRNILPRELRAPVVPSTIQLSAWKTICGDGGWAGSVAEQLLQNPAPLSVIFGPATDTLSLVREVLDLVPAPQRWNITFSTYFTRLLAGAECQLRFVLNDTPEATALRNDARARVVDLTKPLPAATGGALVTIARTGQLTPQEPAPVAPATRTAIQPKENAPADSPKAAVLPALPRFGQPTIGDGTVDLPEIPFPANRSRRKLKPVVALLLFMTVTGTLVATVMFFGKGGKPDKFSEIVANTVPADTQQSIEDSKVSEEQAARERKEAEEKQRTEQLAAEEAEKQKRDADKAVAEKAAADEAARKEVEANNLAAKVALEAVWEKQGPFVFIGNDFIGDDKTWRDSHGQWLFELPKPSETVEREPLPLSVKDQVVKLALFKGAEHLFAGSPYKLELIQSPDDPNNPNKKWIATANPGPNKIELAEYTIERIDSASGVGRSIDCKVHFRWLEQAEREPGSELLRWWPLQINVGSKAAVLLQRSAFHPETVPTWHTLIKSSPSVFSRGEEIKVLRLDKAQGISFDLEILQEGQDPQHMSLTIDPDVSDNREPSADNDEPDPIQKPSTRYFALTLPFRLLENQPPVDDKLLGFGTLQIEVTHAGASDLTFIPRLNLSVRIPKEDFSDNLPSINVNDFLAEVSKTTDYLTNFDPTLTESQINALTTVREELRNDVRKWHTQPLQKLSSKKTFQGSPFFVLKKKAMTEVEKILSITPMPATDQAVELAKKNGQEEFLRKNREHIKIHSFGPAMFKMEDAMKETMGILVKPYEDISTHVNQFLKPDLNILVRCKLLGVVKTPNSDNGDTLSVYFLESDSGISP